MALFTDNDRDKVNEDIDIDDVDEVDEDADQDQDDSTDKKTPPKKDDNSDQDDADQDKDKKPDPKKDKDDEGSADYWKKKFQESTRENQVERERREKAEKQAEELAKPKEITDDSMKQKYPDWDSYDEAVKATLKNQTRMEQELNELKQSQSEYHNERKWQGKIDSFLSENDETEKYDIKDKDGFRKYANKPMNKGLDLDVLAKAFLFEVGSTAEPEDKKKKSGSLFEDGSGQGATGKHKSDKKEYDADDAKRLRENNPREYERLVRAGKIDIKI